MPDGDANFPAPEMQAIGEMVLAQYQRHLSQLIHANFVLEARLADLERRLGEALTQANAAAAAAAPAPAPAKPKAAAAPPDA